MIGALPAYYWLAFFGTLFCGTGIIMLVAAIKIAH